MPTLEEKVREAIGRLAQQITVEGPFVTDRHTNYLVTGLTDRTCADPVDSGEPPICCLCWCLLSLLGLLYEADLSINTLIIGQGHQARENLEEAIRHHLRSDEDLDVEQIERSRDPLIHELIAHVLLLAHRERNLIPLWLNNLQNMRMPHLATNNQGIDLIGFSIAGGEAMPTLGEMKAYEDDPWGGLSDACSKLDEIRKGLHNTEIRGALKSMNFNNDRGQLASNIWMDVGPFGAVIGFDAGCDINIQRQSRAQIVIDQPADRLFFIAIPYDQMRDSFEEIIRILLEQARSVEQMQ